MSSWRQWRHTTNRLNGELAFEPPRSIGEERGARAHSQRVPSERGATPLRWIEPCAMKPFHVELANARRPF